MKFFKVITSYLLIVVMLFSFSEITIKRMLCIASGNTSYTFSRFEGCGEKEQDFDQTELSASCCAFSSVSLDLDSPVLVKSVDFKGCETFLLHFISLSFVAEIYPIDLFKPSIDNYSPPITYHQQLTFLSTFLI